MLSDQQSWRMDLWVFLQHTNLSEWASVVLLKQVDWIVSLLHLPQQSSTMKSDLYILK